MGFPKNGSKIAVHLICKYLYEKYCKIEGSHSSTAEFSSLLGYDIVALSEWFLTF
jgi:hypothetical protein